MSCMTWSNSARVPVHNAVVSLSVVPGSSNFSTVGPVTSSLSAPAAMNLI